jgi:hypothetical protein
LTTTTRRIQDRIVALDWAAMTRDLDSFGCTILKSVLTREECRSIAAMYKRDDIFRSTIVMARHGFGRGEYKYWSYPLPEIVAGLRTALYPPLAAVANRCPAQSARAALHPNTTPCGGWLARTRSGFHHQVVNLASDSESDFKRVAKAAKQRSGRFVRAGKQELARLRLCFGGGPA